MIMRKSIQLLSLSFALLAGMAAPAFASEHGRGSDREPASSSGSWAMGVASTNVITNTESLSALLESGKNWIEIDLGIHHTRGNFQFATGGAYKFTVAGDRHTGFHVGPGLALGTTDVLGNAKFTFSLSGLAGGHFTFGDHLMVSVDGGPVLYVTDGNVDFRMRPRGDILGVGVYYLF
jgi:hypothetical protein